MDRDMPANDRKFYWNPERIDDLLDNYAYVQNDRRTKAYMGWVSPDEFLRATTPRAERARLEAEAKPLDLHRLHAERQEMFLHGRIDRENEFFELHGHEGRHRMVALRNAGYERVPVTFYVYSGHCAEDVQGLMVLPQRYEHAASERGFLMGRMTPISWAKVDELRRTFSQPEPGIELVAHKDTAAVLSAAQRARQEVDELTRLQSGARPALG